jgi:site-specific recombinase XerD
MARPVSRPEESIEVLDAGPVASEAQQREHAAHEVPMELLTSWLTGRQANTREAYATDLALYTAWCAGQGLQPLSAAPADIDAFINAQVRTSGSATVARRVSSLASWYRHLVVIGRMAVSPLDQVSRPSRAGYSEERRTLSATDLDRLRAQADADIVAAAQASRARAYLTALCRAAILRMFIGTDIGPGLIVRLDVDDLGFDGDGEWAVMWLRDGEGTRYRHRVPDDAAGAIRAYLAARAHADGVGVHELAGPLFVTGHGATGARLGPATPAAMIRRLAAAAGIDDPGRVSPAVLRRAPGLALTRRIAASQVEEPPGQPVDVRARYLRRWVNDPLERDPAMLLADVYAEHRGPGDTASARPAPSATRVEPIFAPPRSARHSQRSPASRDSGPRPAVRQPASPLAPVRRLPRDVAPFRDETVRSYEARLAAANHLSVAELRAAAGCRGLLSADDLSALTGRAPRTLLMALPELRATQRRLDLPPDSRWPHPPTPQNARSGRSALIRPACGRCTAARGATGEVLTWTPNDVQICLKHALWIGGQDPLGQWDVRDLPQLAAAQRHHTNLVRRHGRPAAQTSYRQAVQVTAWWAQHGCWSDGALARRHVLTGVTGGTPHDKDPIIALMYYPEAVGLLSLFVSPYWIRVLGEQPRRDLWDSPLTRRFHAEVRRRTGYDATGAAVDPLSRWCEQIGVRAPAATQVAP